MHSTYPKKVIVTGPPVSGFLWETASGGYEYAILGNGGPT